MRSHWSDGPQPDPERDLRLGRFWFDELETSLERMDLEAAKYALRQLWVALSAVDNFLTNKEGANL